MQIFYSPEIAHGLTHFNELESKHAVRVLRLKAGDEVHVIDGIGGLYKVTIKEANQRKCSFSIIEKQENYEKRDFYLHIAIAPTKNIDRLEWFLEKATEIGIDEITPLLCDHSERKVIKPERLNKIIISAAKQSLKAYVPRLNPMISFDEFVDIQTEADCYLAHCYDTQRTPLSKLTEYKNTCIAIGPEGDFSEREVNLSQLKQFVPTSLGNSRLRTETAAVVACHTITLLNS